MASLISRPVPLSCSYPVARSVTQLRSGQSISYLLYDQFLTTEAAPIASPRTCEPGPGTVTVVHGGTSQLEITAGGKLSVATANSGHSGIYDGGSARTAGRMLIADINDSNLNQKTLLGWQDTAAVDDDPDLGIKLDNTIAYFRGPGQAQIATRTVGVEMECAIIQRATGYHILHNDSGTWKLLYVEHAKTTATVYASWSNRDATVTGATCDNFRVPDLSWLPPAIANDSFDRSDSDSLGSTDGAGIEEIGGSGLAWTEVHGDTDIASNKAAWGSNGVDGFAMATVDTSTADVVISCKVTTATGGKSGVVLRASDKDNLWLVELDNDTNNIKIHERTSGTWTERAATAVTIADATEYTVLVVAEGSTITAYVNNGSRVNYGSATANQTATEQGLYATATSQSFDDFGVFDRSQSTFPIV